MSDFSHETVKRVATMGDKSEQPRLCQHGFHWGSGQGQCCKTDLGDPPTCKCGEHDACPHGWCKNCEDCRDCEDGDAAAFRAAHAPTVGDWGKL